MFARLFCLLTLCWALIGTGAAQTANPSVEDVPFTHLAEALLGVNVPLLTANCPPPIVGLHCAYYAGDFSPKPVKQPNGLLNGIFHNGADVIDGQVWVPLQVKKKIVIQGIFVNQLFASAPPPNAPAHWEIRLGISPGNGGMVQCGGDGTATRGTTGRSFTFGGTVYTEYNYVLMLAPADYCELWNPAPPPQPAMTDQPSGGKGSCPPDCYISMAVGDSGAVDAPTSLNFGYLSDVPNPGPHHRGLPNVYDGSFYFSTKFQRNFEPTMTMQNTGVCASPHPDETITTGGCHLFSVGIIGTGH